jgi:hypothetical protein
MNQFLLSALCGLAEVPDEERADTNSGCGFGMFCIRVPVTAPA